MLLKGSRICCYSVVCLKILFTHSTDNFLLATVCPLTFFFLLAKSICMADEALTVSCLFLSGKCGVLVVQERYPRMWSYALKLCLRSALAHLFCPELPVLQIQGLVWGGAQRRDQGCHCCCWGAHTSSA